MATADRAPHEVRRANTRACLVALREAGGPSSLRELASRTGLSRPTVDAVLQNLSAAGLVARTEPTAPTAPGQQGRPARRFALDPSAVTVAALDIGASSVRSLVVDTVGTAITHDTRPAGSELDLAATIRAVCPPGRIPQAVGLAVPGILDADGRITQSLARPDLVGRDLAAELGRELGCAVSVENDIKLAALAERHLGRPAQDIVFVQIGHRISVALIVGGMILQGSHRLAGELGIQRGMRWTAGSRRGRLVWSTGDEARPVFERAAAGDPDARDEIEGFCAEIAPRLATVLLTVDPELVVIGGGLSRAGETLLGPLRRALHHLLRTPDRPEVVAARLTTDGSLTGALGTALERSSEHLFGVPDVPPPWPRFPAAPGAARSPETDPHTDTGTDTDRTAHTPQETP